MVLPWELILTGLAALGVGLVVLRWRAALADVDWGALADAAVTIGLFAFVGARLGRLTLDVLTAGTALDARALITLGSGVSTPAGVLGGLIGGVWVHRRHDLPDRAWPVLATAVAAGLGAWSALAVARGEVVGIAAPAPVGVTLGGATGVPVAWIEAVAFGALAVWLARTGHDRGVYGGTLLAAAVAVIYLGGSVLRPPVPTVDGEVDLLLGLVALLTSVLLTRGVGARRVAAVATTAVVALAGLTVASTGGGIAPDTSEADITGTEELIAGAITAGGTEAEPPAWTAGDLTAFVEAAGDRPVVVNFWASWCPPCHGEAPALARTARALGDRAVFVGANVDDQHAEAQSFVDRYHLPFASIDGDALRGHLGMRGLPTTVVLRPDGTVADRLVGGLDAGSLAAAVDHAARSR